MLVALQLLDFGPRKNHGHGQGRGTCLNPFSDLKNNRGSAPVALNDGPPLLIDFISLVVEAFLALVTYQEFSVMLRLLTVASLSSTISKFLDCVKIVVNVDNPLGAR